MSETVPCCVRAVTACIEYGRAEVSLWALQLMLTNIKHFYLQDQAMVIFGSLCFSLLLSQKEREGGKESAMKGDFAITVLENRSLPISHIMQATKAVHVAKS